MNRLSLSSCGMALLLTVAVPAAADTLYVNNLTGSDRNDGRTPTVTSPTTGPVRGVDRVSRLVRAGDRIEIAATGVPYYGSLTLADLGGVPGMPTVVNGNGAMLDGSELADATAWKSLGNNLWRLDPPRKGWFLLVRDGVALPEVAADRDEFLPPLSPTHWAAWNGLIYYRAEPDERPPLGDFRLATREAGLLLSDVRHVVVRDLTLRHYHLDGVSVHDRATDVTLQNLTATANARAGVFVGGSSRVTLSGGAIRDNREVSLLIREVATVAVQGTELDTPPVLRD